MTLKSIFNSTITNHADIATEALNKGLIKVNEVTCNASESYKVFRWCTKHNVLVPEFYYALVDTQQLFYGYTDSTVNRKRILAELNSRVARSTDIPYDRFVDKDIKEYVKQICERAKDSELRVLRKRFPKLCPKFRVKREPRKQKTTYDRIVILFQRRNIPAIKQIVSGITKQEWELTKKDWLASSIAHTAVWSPFLTVEEARLIWMAPTCPLSLATLEKLTITKDVLLSLPTTRLVQICEQHYSDMYGMEVIIDPSLNDADETYLAMISTSPIVNAGIQRSKELKLIQLLTEVAKRKLPRKINLAKRDKKMISVMCGYSVWTYFYRVKVLEKYVKDILSWWNNINDESLKIAWARVLGEFIHDPYGE